MTPSAMLSRLNLCGDALPAPVRSAFWTMTVKLARREELTRGELDALELAYVEVVGPQDALQQQARAATAARLEQLVAGNYEDFVTHLGELERLERLEREEREGKQQKRAKAVRRSKRQGASVPAAHALSEPNAHCSCGAWLDACHRSGHAARMGGAA